ncbi:MAG: hypothetical protein PHU51_03050 [Candidatus Nanoarchaeia archaeon]|nr:hypothetical protein [Candidatus Nanoarchaeia archaeon]
MKIFHSKKVFEELEFHRENICEEMLHLDKINNLNEQGNFLQEQISKSIKEGLIEFQYGLDVQRHQSIKTHELLNAFIGKHNIQLLLTNMK